MDIAEMLLASLKEMCELVETGEVPQSDLDSAVEELYERIVGKYRPVIMSIPTLAMKIAEDIEPVATGIVRANNAVISSDGFRRAIEQNTKIKAEARMIQVQTYIVCGFTREEAMAIILQEMAGASAARNAALGRSSITLPTSRR